MNILLVGAGKMGGLICRELEKIPEIDKLYICDIAFDEDKTEGRKILFRDIEHVRNAAIDVAFVASTANTHFEILKTLIGFGIRRIFVEKPAVMSMEEYEGIMSMASDCRIATGYILRHADSVRKMKLYIDGLLNEGYHLVSCDVHYAKYLPVTAEPRAMTDIGIFEETPHIWDLLFNYLGFLNADKIVEKTVSINYEEAKPDRAIEAKMEYECVFGGNTATVSVYSSFLSAQRRRHFHFVYANGNSQRIILLDLDKEDFHDALMVTDESGAELHNEQFASLTKLGNEINAVINYLMTGQEGEVSTFETEKTLLKARQ